MVNKFYYPRGGTERYFFSLSELLRKEGHKVIPFSTLHEKNLDSEYSSYFLPELDFEKVFRKGRLSAAIGLRNKVLYSFESKRKIGSLIEREKPDIAHLHNIHYHITPSILPVLKDNGIRIVWTLHDYTIICPDTHFLSDGKVCEECKNSRYYRAVFKRCKRGSFGASLVAGFGAYMYRWMGLYDLVDLFLCPSDFLRKKMIEYGFDEKRLITIPNFVENMPLTEPDNNSYILYLGRLSREKGVKTFLGAAEKIPYINFKIIGDGLQRETLEGMIKEKGLSNIELLGERRREEVYSFISKALFVIIPSQWYENCPYSILESFLLGKTVIASSIGGIPELVDNGIDGLLFDPGNDEDLVRKIKYLLSNKDTLGLMGKRAGEKVRSLYNPEIHYERILKAYNMALGIIV